MRRHADAFAEATHEGAGRQAAGLGQLGQRNTLDQVFAHQLLCLALLPGSQPALDDLAGRADAAIARCQVMAHRQQHVIDKQLVAAQLAVQDRQQALPQAVDDVVVDKLARRLAQFAAAVLAELVSQFTQRLARHVKVQRVHRLAQPRNRIALQIVDATAAAP